MEPREKICIGCRCDKYCRLSVILSSPFPRCPPLRSRPIVRYPPLRCPVYAPRPLIPPISSLGAQLAARRAFARPVSGVAITYSLLSSRIHTELPNSC
ncbi:hypothetical protein B0T18DRAFT_106880 [Schizothecium vesticola]|uniref:Uncharacterized protein n=1 Tax=Schizothecium vesticola TaxID=314040 RepID=A0AA40K8P5_9PEZI|nr:hypothetical protein B0T18DRAFT_106880 [Schizothecium vesticola]